MAENETIVFKTRAHSQTTSRKKMTVTPNHTETEPNLERKDK